MEEPSPFHVLQPSPRAPCRAWIHSTDFGSKPRVGDAREKTGGISGRIKKGSLLRQRARDGFLKEVPFQAARERWSGRRQNVPGGGNSMYKCLEVGESVV